MKLKENKLFRCIVIPICIAFTLFFRFIPAPYGLSQDAMGVFGIFIGCLILWLTIGIDWPSLLCIFALGLLDNLKFGTLFQQSFGNSTFIFLLFTFVCTYAISKTSLIKRISIWFISNKLARRSGWWFSILFLLSVLVLGCFISPSVLFVIILPILKEILQMAKVEKGEKSGKMLMMGLAFTVSISSGMTPIAHVFPILSMNAAGISVGYGKYMLFAVPIGIIVFALMLLMFRLFLKPDMSKLKNVDVVELKKELPPINKAEIISLIIFIFVILLWIIPSLFQNIAPEFYNFINQYGTAMPPILGTILLCVINIDGKPLVKIDDAMKNGVPWASLIMCAGTLALGYAISNDAIGIKQFLQTNLSTSLSSVSSIALLIIFVVWAMLQTNLSSNMVTATLVATVASGILSSITNSLNINAVICLIGMVSAYAFATPPSMPHIAIAAGSEYADTKSLLIYGSILMFVATIIIVCAGYPLASLIV